MAVEEDGEGGGIPEWVVTFGDMMSLLLTFFIMLVSLSEIKKDEQFQALAEAMRKQFGHNLSMVNPVPGRSPPRNSAIAKMATMGRSRRLDIMRGGDEQRAPTGDYSRVRLIRPGKHSGVGTVITFGEGIADLDNQLCGNLQIIADELRGKPQRIEIRGHTSRRPLDLNRSDKENYELALNLAYRRCRQTMDFLASSGIKRQRFRISVAGPNEPLEVGTDAARLMENPRVEVFMLDEVVADLEGTDAQRNQNYEVPAVNEDVEGGSSASSEERKNG